LFLKGFVAFLKVTYLTIFTQSLDVLINLALQTQKRAARQPPPSKIVNRL